MCPMCVETIAASDVKSLSPTQITRGGAEREASTPEEEVISHRLNNQCCGSESGSTGSICFWASGSGAISKRYGSGSDSGSGSFYHHAKIVRKPLIPTIL